MSSCLLPVGLATVVAAACLEWAVCSAEPMQAAGPMTVFDTSRDAYARPAPALPTNRRDAFFRGRSLFRQVWVVAPSADASVDGLGPVFNRPSCISCHVRNGRGFAPDGPGEELRAMLVRLSLPGRTSHGAPVPVPGYGDQLNDAAIPGVPPEGRVSISYEVRIVALGGRETIELRRPVIGIRDLAFGPLGPEVLRSARIGPAVYGLGLLEGVGVDALEQLAARPGSRAGRLNRVWDDAASRWVVGRFGAKANQPTVRQQVAAAFLGDLGITTPVYPAENCAAGQDACRDAVDGGTPELTSDQLDDLVTYLIWLGVPARRDSERPEVRNGERLFARFGCADCHVPSLPLGTTTEPAGKAQHIQPWTDLLLHDMGPDLSDGRPDFEATGHEWRTAPLWGIGLAERVGGRVGYLHDGRARTLLEAILWHGGEAADARDAVAGAAPGERAALLAFLRSL